MQVLGVWGGRIASWDANLSPVWLLMGCGEKGREGKRREGKGAEEGEGSGREGKGRGNRRI